MLKFGSAGRTNNFGILMAAATTVPFHKGRDISPVLLRKIARDIGMTADDFVRAP